MLFWPKRKMMQCKRICFFSFKILKYFMYNCVGGKIYCLPNVRSPGNFALNFLQNNCKVFLKEYSVFHLNPHRWKLAQISCSQTLSIRSLSVPFFLSSSPFTPSHNLKTLFSSFLADAPYPAVVFVAYHPEARRFLQVSDYLF